MLLNGALYFDMFAGHFSRPVVCDTDVLYPISAMLTESKINYAGDEVDGERKSN